MGAIEVEFFGWFRGLFLLSHPPMFPIIFFLLLFLKYS
jgi:hypothetical protein